MLGGTQQEGAHEVCDYSLEHVASRPAKVGDELITTKFGESVTRGFSAVGEPNVAVCLLPGTEIVFAKKPKHSNRIVRFFLGLDLGNLSGKVARFRQVDLHNPRTFHDAVELADGKIKLLTLLRPGQRATVLQLPPQPHPLRKDVGRAVSNAPGLTADA